MSEPTGAFGHCDYVKKVPSRSVTQIIIELPVEYHVAAVQMFDGKDVWVEAAPDQLRGKPYAIISPDMRGDGLSSPEKNHHASALYRVGFFNVPEVLEAVGTPEQYREWVQHQASAFSHKFSEYIEASGEYRSIAAHVRRVADGAGTAIKNDYGEIPLTQEEHARQHNNGESALASKSWFDSQLVKHRALWMAHTVFKKERMGQVDPVDVVRWALHANVHSYLPREYRDGVKLPENVEPWRD